MAVPKAIIITSVPKYIGNDGALNSEVGIKLKPGNSILRCNNNNTQVIGKMVLPQSNSFATSKCEEVQPVMTNRKRRLDHLTLEEKLQRKKLKNRVAAQSSRDRKKARLEDLEIQAKALREKNDALTLQCHNLQREKAQLATENEELRNKLSKLERNHQTQSVCCSTQVEPAEFSINPLPQGWALQQAMGPKAQVLTMCRIVMFCLLSQISSIVSMEMCASLIWMNWHKVYSEKLQKTWTQGMTRTVPRLDLMDAKERAALLKWWGRHQKTWKPVEN